MDDSHPLSDTITELTLRPTAAALARFQEELLRAQVGVTLQGLPPDATGRVQVQPGDRFVFDTAGTPDGHVMIRVRADWRVFARRFGPSFNAVLDAVAVLETVAADPSCQGVMVNSAVTFHSVTMDREAVLRLLARGRVPAAPPPKRWWRFW